MQHATLILAALTLLLGDVGQAKAEPIVSYTANGSTGDWTLDFSVENPLGGTNDIYFFGVDVANSTLVGIPAGWELHSSPWSNQPYGGSSTNYDDNWISASNGSDIIPGETLGGFTIHTTDATIPTSVQWYAYAVFGQYTGSDYFNSSSNPGFEGVADFSTPPPSAVPEPSSLVLLGIGAAGLGVFRLRRRKPSSS